MKKRLLLSFLAGALAAAGALADNYGINVGGVEVSTSNQNSVTGGDISGGTVTYNPDTKTLTLTNVSIYRSGSSDRAVHNRSVDGLTIVLAGNCTFSGTSCSTVYLQKSTTINVTGITTIRCSSSGDDIIYMNNSGSLTITGPGILNMESTSGDGIEGNGNGTVNVSIANLITNCAHGSFYKLKSLTFSKSNGSYHYNKGLRYTTDITFKPTGGSSYAHVRNVTTFTVSSPMNVLNGLTASNLQNSSYYNTEFAVSDAENNPSYTAVGNFLYSTVTYDGTTMAQLMGPTLASRNTAASVSTLEVPGSVTLGGAARPVYVNNDALRDFTNARLIQFNVGVAYIGNRAFAGLPNLETVRVPGTLRGMGTFLGQNSGSSGSTFNLYWCSISPGTVDCSTTTFSGLNHSTQKAFFPSSITNNTATAGFTNSRCTDPSLVADLFNSSSNGYYVVSVPAWTSTSGGELAFIGSHASATSAKPGTDAVIASGYYHCTSVATDACRDNTKLSSVDLSDSYLKSIGNNAFRNCTAVTTLTVGSNVTNVGTNAFAYMTGLKTVNWNMTACPHFTESTRPFYGSNNISTATFGSNVTRIPAYLFYNANLASVSTSASIIGDFAFYQNASLSSVTLGEGVQQIGKMAFYGAVGVNRLTVPSTVTSMGMSAFGYWSSLKWVTWNAKSCADFTSTSAPFSDMKSVVSMSFGGVTRIPAYLCYNLNKITSVTIPSSVTSIGDKAFSGCTGLTTVGWYAANCGDFTLTTAPFYNLSGITSFTFGNTVTRIPAYLCYYLKGITAITIPAAVTSIGNYAFSDCSNVKTINWNATACGNFSDTYKPFSGLTNVTTFKIGTNVTKIPAYLCGGLSGVTSITIPNSVTTINDYAFMSTGLTSVSIPSAVTTMGARPFFSCSNLKTVYWEAHSCNDFNERTAPFLYLNITTFSFGNYITKIPAYLCYNLSQVTSVTIPGSITSIGQSAFSGCSGLATITSALAAPQNLTYGAGIFDGVNKQTCVLNIPGGTLALYKATSPWREFFNIIDPNAGTFKQGDVNGDGIISGADVTALYDYLLEGKAVGGDGDVNGDGIISGADVTALYGILLEQ